jgi:lambda repressor-like predicted transcriptional regulator
VKVSLDKIVARCRERGTSVASMLREAGVSRNAFYTLARKESLVPQSLVRVSEYLNVPVSELLDDTPPAVERARELMDEVNRIVKRHPGADPDNIRHTLLLLDEEPIERLRRALRRGRPVNIR